MSPFLRGLKPQAIFPNYNTYFNEEPYFFLLPIYLFATQIIGSAKEHVVLLWLSGNI